MTEIKCKALYCIFHNTEDEGCSRPSITLIQDDDHNHIHITCSNHKVPQCKKCVHGKEKGDFNVKCSKEHTPQFWEGHVVKCPDWKPDWEKYKT